ncbi:MAG: hypothetical protein K5985_02610 [Lachnospiraceae bacterium]|nr:hypothetical protein [Lachnospiraceae bacterium]
MEENSKETSVIEKDTQIAAEEETGETESGPGEDAGQDADREKTQGRSRFVYGIRIACGAYLVYLSWNLIKDIGTAEGWHRAVVIIAAGLFTLAGAGLVIVSARRLIEEGRK